MWIERLVMKKKGKNLKNDLREIPKVINQIWKP